MMPLRIEGCTREMAKHQKEYTTLCIKDVMVGEEPVMLSKWEPTPAELKIFDEGGWLWCGFWTGEDTIPALLRPLEESELKALRAGASIMLAIPGKQHPPVCPSAATAEEVPQLMKPPREGLVKMVVVADA